MSLNSLLNSLNSMQLSNRIIKSILYFLIVGGFGVLVLEITAKSILNRHLKESLAIYEPFGLDNKNILNVTPNYTGQWKNPEFFVQIRTNSKGYREDFEFEDSDIDVAFMGDSFTFGWGINVENRYSNIVARNYPQIVVANLSPPNGWQPEHYEYFLDRHPDIKPKLLFVAVYLGNDLESDLIETVIERDDLGKIKALHTPYREIYRGLVINKIEYRYKWFSSLVKRSAVGKLIARQINISRFRNLLVIKKGDCKRSDTKIEWCHGSKQL